MPRKLKAMRGRPRAIRQYLVGRAAMGLGTSQLQLGFVGFKILKHKTKNPKPLNWSNLK